jgi:hypothetical protein
MKSAPTSPKILRHAWGKVEIDGFGQFKDVKLYPGGARKWNWNETGTSHTPGIQLTDAEELLEHGSQVVILTSGVLGSLKVPPETISALEERGVTVHVARTPKAIELYNQLREKEAVGALIHSTC